jgi:hypothetical protein
MEKSPKPSVEYTAAIILSLVSAYIAKTEWQKLRLAVGEAITSGRAYGVADAMELLADKISATNFDFDRAFSDARYNFENDPTVLGQVDNYLDQLLNDVSNNVAKKLAKMADDGATAEEMRQYLEDNLGDGTSPLFSIFLHVIVLAAITFGIKWFFKDNGVAMVYFITAGDELVCPECDEIEQANPYELADAPDPPIHQNCRCSLFTDDTISSSAISDYLT